MDHPNLTIIIERVSTLCRIVAPRTMLTDLRERFDHLGLTHAVARHDTPALYDWLMRVLSYQGVSDAIAWDYMNRNGTVGFADVAAALAQEPACPKLRCYWQFDACRFAKEAFTCSQPDHIEGCLLPSHDLRNGRLNQTAYSLFLFLRDVCDGDVVAWLDHRLAEADRPHDPNRASRMRQSLLEALSGIYGVSFKVLAMALADLLLAGDTARERWVSTGASMIAIDTLVHNWLHRTGGLHDLGAEHLYGLGCYAQGGCADIVEAVSQHINARQFCPAGPAVFPRLIQKSIWLFCTEAALDMCNGNRIDDRVACQQRHCELFHSCGRWPLHG